MLFLQPQFVGGLQKEVSAGAFFGPKNAFLAISPSYELRTAQPRTLFGGFGTFRTQWWYPFDLILITKFFAASVCISDLHF